MHTLPVLSQLPRRNRERSVLLVRPTFYDVLYEINPHMKGKVGTVDKPKAMSQWKELRHTYTSLGYTVHILEGVEHLPDMVFCANQTFPFVDAQNKRNVILSKMASEYRVPEVQHLAKWYKEQDYHIIEQTYPPVEFEGMGDAIWHPHRKLLYIGYGFRTHADALQRAANCIGCDVIGLELIQPHFYHLDTALSMIDEDSALYIPEAFTQTGIAILKRMFPNLLAVPLHEAKYGFVTNGHSPDGKHFIVHKGNQQTKAILQSTGLRVLELDTGEFMKSGGSVFCMKMMLP